MEIVKFNGNSAVAVAGTKHIAEQQNAVVLEYSMLATLSTYSASVVSYKKWVSKCIDRHIHSSICGYIYRAQSGNDDAVPHLLSYCA